MHAHSSTTSTTPEAVIAAALLALTGADNAAAQRAAATDCGAWNHVRDLLWNARQQSVRAAKTLLARLQKQFPDLKRLLATAGGGAAAPQRGKRKPSAAQWLIDHADRHAELFHTSGRETYALVMINNVRQTIALAERDGIRRWLERAYYVAHRAPPPRAALDEVVGVLDARALYDGLQREVWLRVAYDQSTRTLYLDLADDRWRAVAIDATGWRIVESVNLPVVFRRGDGALPLPEPQPGGSLEELRSVLRLRVTDQEWLLLCGWLFAGLMPPGPGTLPILGLIGEAGGGKSWLAQMLRRLIDPHKAMAGVGDIDDEERLIMQAMNNHIVQADNLSVVTRRTADLFCRLATGGAFIKRMLYTNARAVTFDVKRLGIVTATSDILTFSDLLDRTLIIRPTVIRRYEAESELDRAFAEAHPRLLGALLSAISAGLRHVATTPVPNIRLADFGRWAEACGVNGLGWEPGAFTQAFLDMRADGARVVLENDALVEEIERLLAKSRVWSGTPEELHTALELHIATNSKPPKWFPADAARLIRRLQNIAGDLRRVGIEFTPPQQRRMPGGTRKRILRIERIDPQQGQPQQQATPEPVQPTIPEPPPAPAPEPAPAPPNGIPPVPDGVDPARWRALNWEHLRKIIVAQADDWERAVRVHLATRGVPPDAAWDGIRNYFSKEAGDGS